MSANKNDNQNGNGIATQQPKQPSARRQQLVDRFKQGNPDFNGDDDEAVYGAMLDRFS